MVLTNRHLFRVLQLKERPIRDATIARNALFNFIIKEYKYPKVTKEIEAEIRTKITHFMAELYPRWNAVDFKEDRLESKCHKWLNSAIQMPAKSTGKNYN